MHQGFGFADHFLLLGRNDHVFLAKRDTRRTGVTEAKRHDRVGEQHCLLLAGVAIYGIDDVADLLLREKAIDHIERHLVALRQRFTDEHAARRGLGALHLRSEEHTSELQSLMRISYAVFCLKKKKKI